MTVASRFWRSPASDPGLAAAVPLGLVFLGVIVASALGDAEAARKGAADWICRWEVAAARPWLEDPSGGPAAPPPQPVTLLLDQCSGRTWTLAFVRGAFEWRPVRRDPEFGFVLERP